MANKKEYYDRNKEHLIEKAKQWASRNREKVRLFKKKYRMSNKEKHNIYNKARMKTYQHTLLGKFSQYKHGAKRRGLVFGITLKQFEELFNSTCYYCGDTSKGIDRFDNSMGYLPDNSVACCAICNRMKFNYSAEDFINHCEKITKNYNG